MKGFSEGVSPLTKFKKSYDSGEDYGNIFDDFREKIEKNEHPHYGLLDFDKVRQYLKEIDPEAPTPNKITQILVELLIYIDSQNYCDAPMIDHFQRSASLHADQIHFIMNRLATLNERIDSLEKENRRFKEKIDEFDWT